MPTNFIFKNLIFTYRYLYIHYETLNSFLKKKKKEKKKERNERTNSKKGKDTSRL